MKYTLTNIILAVLFLLAAVLCFVFFSNLKDTQTKLEKAQHELEQYKKMDELNQLSEQFLHDFAKGNYKGYLTGAELSKYETGEKEGHIHQEGEGLIEDINIKQLYTKIDKENKDIADSYATIDVRYKTSDSDALADKYFQTLSLKSKWIDVSGKWKIEQLDVSLLKDSNDEMLRQQAEEELKKSREESSNE